MPSRMRPSRNVAIARASRIPATPAGVSEPLEQRERRLRTCARTVGSLQVHVDDRAHGERGGAGGGVVARFGEGQVDQLRGAARVLGAGGQHGRAREQLRPLRPGPAGAERLAQVGAGAAQVAGPGAGLGADLQEQGAGAVVGVERQADIGKARGLGVGEAVQVLPGGPPVRVGRRLPLARPDQVTGALGWFLERVREQLVQPPALRGGQLRGDGLADQVMRHRPALLAEPDQLGARQDVEVIQHAPLVAARHGCQQSGGCLPAEQCEQCEQLVAGRILARGAGGDGASLPRAGHLARQGRRVRAAGMPAARHVLAQRPARGQLADRLDDGQRGPVGLGGQQVRECPVRDQLGHGVA